LLAELGRAVEEAGRHRVLEQLALKVQTFKAKAGPPGLLPLWQTAAALDGLVAQFTHQINTVTPSTLRTVASAVDLLDELCGRTCRSNLPSLASIRLLVVDDDLISRRAISFALKRAFNQPDLAESGQEALPLAEKQRYDMIFLDVQMPGMDGFELCSEIHRTTANRATPVVFVTCHSDFESRTKSIVSGGADLIAKPFLSFELTLKTLVCVLRARLREDQARNNHCHDLSASTPPAPTRAPAARQNETTAIIPPLNHKSAAAAQVKRKAKKGGREKSEVGGKQPASRSGVRLFGAEQRSGNRWRFRQRLGCERL